MLEPVVLLPHRLPNVFVAPLPGVDDVGVGDLGGVINPILTGKWVNFKYILEWSTKISKSTFEGLGEMFEGHTTDTGAGKFPLTSMGG